MKPVLGEEGWAVGADMLAKVHTDCAWQKKRLPALEKRGKQESEDWAPYRMDAQAPSVSP